jgi:hypothetical protein
MLKSNCSGILYDADGDTSMKRSECTAKRLAGIFYCAKLLTIGRWTSFVDFQKKKIVSWNYV